MMGVAKFLVDRDVGLRLDFDDPRESFMLKGKFIRSEEIEGKKDMVALSIEFAESLIPMGYKVRLNDYISVYLRPEQKHSGGAVQEAVVETAPEAAKS